MATFATYTLGCKVSQYESVALSEELERLGLCEVDFSDFADAYIINTCTVTAESDAKSRKYIRRALRANPDAVVAVMGCYSQRSPEQVAAIKGVSIVAGTADKMKLAPMIVELLSQKASREESDDGNVGKENKISHTDTGDGEGRAGVSRYSPYPAGSEAARGCKKTTKCCFSPSVTEPQRDKGDGSAVGEVLSSKYDETTSSNTRIPIITTKFLDNETFEPMCITRPERTRAYVKIEDGCDSLPQWGKGDRSAVDEVLSSKYDETTSSNTRIPIITTKSLDNETFEPMCITRPERTRAYVKIEDGCECRCTYCAIADARGPVRSKRPEDVIREVEALYKNGTREIVLTGIETGSYGADFPEKYDLGDLIAELDRRGSCERIRLGSLAPELIGEKFIAKVRDTKILAPHFHLSMQSGSDAVLRGMKRRYNTEMALRNMSVIREAFPSATFTTDLMVGFPGETDADFLETVEFVKKARFLDCHVFAYSRREGTPAAEYECQIPEDVKRRRSEILIAEKNKVRDSVLLEICEHGEPLSCIFENKRRGFWISHSDTFAEVRAESDSNLSGKLLSVVPKRVEDGVIYGEIL